MFHHERCEDLQDEHKDSFRRSKLLLESLAAIQAGLATTSALSYLPISDDQTAFVEREYLSRYHDLAHIIMYNG